MVATLALALLLNGTVEPRVAVRVSIDQDGGRSALHLQLAIDELREIWRDAGVAVSSGRYGEPSGPDEAVISMRILTSPARRTKERNRSLPGDRHRTRTICPGVVRVAARGDGSGPRRRRAGPSGQIGHTRPSRPADRARDRPGSRARARSLPSSLRWTSGSRSDARELRVERARRILARAVQSSRRGPPRRSPERRSVGSRSSGI